MKIKPLGSTKFCGIRDQNSHHFWNQLDQKFGLKYGISDEKIYLVTTLKLTTIDKNAFKEEGLQTDILQILKVTCQTLKLIM